MSTQDQNSGDSAQSVVAVTEFEASQTVTTIARDPVAVVHTGDSSTMRDYRSLSPYTSTGLSTALERMYVIETAPWTTAQAVNTNIMSHLFPSDLRSFPNISGKLASYRYMRSDLRLRFKTNGTIAHAGKLLWYAIPCQGQEGGLNAAPYDVFQATGFPYYGELSANSPQTVEITLPYLYPQPAFSLPIAEGAGQLWTVGLIVLNPLQAPTSPGSVNVTMEAGFYNTRVWGILEQSDEQKMQLSSIANSAGSNNPINGILNGTLQAVSSVAPILDKILGTKPLSIAPYQVVSNDYAADFNAAGNSSLPTVSSYTRDKNLVVPPAVADHEWQEDMSKVAQSPMLYDIIDVSAVTTPGSIVWSRPITPRHMYGSNVTNGANTKNIGRPDRLNWVSQFFTMWRGSVEYLFSFAAPQMNGCALRVCYFPSSSAIPSTLTDTGDVISNLVEVRGDTQIRITFPYLSNAYYTPLPNDYAALTDDMYNAGWVVIYLERPSLAPGSGTNSIYMSVYRAGGPDTVFAAPGVNYLRPPAESVADGSFSYTPSVLVPSAAPIVPVVPRSPVVPDPSDPPTYKSKRILTQSLLETWKTSSPVPVGPFSSTTPGPVVTVEYPMSLRTWRSAPVFYGLTAQSSPYTVPPPFIDYKDSAFPNHTCNWAAIYALIFQFVRGGFYWMDTSTQNLKMAKCTTNTHTLNDQYNQPYLAFSQRGFHFPYRQTMPYVDKSYIESVPVPGMTVSTPVFSQFYRADATYLPFTGYVSFLGASSGNEWFVHSCDDDVREFSFLPPPLVLLPNSG